MLFYQKYCALSSVIHALAFQTYRGMFTSIDLGIVASMTVQQNSTGFAPEHTGTALKPEYIHAPMGTCVPHTISNGGSALQTIMHTVVDMSAHARRIDASSNMLPTQSSDIGIVQGMNGGMIKSEPGYSGNIPFMFAADGNALETRPAIGDGSFNGVEANSQTLNEQQPLLEADTSTFGFLGQIPRNFSLSDLTASFSQGSGISSLSLNLMYYSKS